MPPHSRTLPQLRLFVLSCVVVATTGAVINLVQSCNRLALLMTVFSDTKLNATAPAVRLTSRSFWSHRPALLGHNVGSGSEGPYILPCSLKVAAWSTTAEVKWRKKSGWVRRRLAWGNSRSQHQQGPISEWQRPYLTQREECICHIGIFQGRDKVFKIPDILVKLGDKILVDVLDTWVCKNILL